MPASTSTHLLCRQLVVKVVAKKKLKRQQQNHIILRMIMTMMMMMIIMMTRCVINVRLPECIKQNYDDGEKERGGVEEMHECF